MLKMQFPALAPAFASEASLGAHKCNESALQQRQATHTRALMSCSDQPCLAFMFMRRPVVPALTYTHCRVCYLDGIRGDGCGCEPSGGMSSIRWGAIQAIHFYEKTHRMQNHHTQRRPSSTTERRDQDVTSLPLRLKKRLQRLQCWQSP